MSTNKIRLGVRRSTPRCRSLSVYTVDRATSSPTVTITPIMGSGQYGSPRSVTPYHLMGRLGIRGYNHVRAGAVGDIDAHYSVHSYLWAMEYFGYEVYVRTWPENHDFPGSKGTLTPHGRRWLGRAYRPEYAFLALLSFLGWEEDGVVWFISDMRRLSRMSRLPTLRRTAVHYLQNPRDSGAPNGFWTLAYDGGSGVNFDVVGY